MKKKKVECLLLMGMMLFGVMPAISVVFAETPNHKPIIITNDNEFTPDNGVVSGSGTKDDPYIIENWVIQATGNTPYGSAGIFIANATKYFVIRNVTIFGGDWGVILDNVSNFAIEDSKFYEISNYAITVNGKNGEVKNNEAWNIDSFLWITGENFTAKNNYIHDLAVKTGSATIGIGIDANNVVVADNVIDNMNGNGQTYADGILVVSPSKNITIQNNTISNIYNVTFGEGIVLYTLNDQIEKVTIERNKISGIPDNGIDIDGHNGGLIDSIIISSNNVSNGNTRGILIYYSNGNVTIKNNIIKAGGNIAGIGIEHSSNISIINNHVHDANNKGIHILSSSDVEIMNSTIYNNVRGIWIEQGSKNIYIESDNISSNQQGMVILYSKNITMRSNTFENNTYSLGIWAGTDVNGYYHDIDTSNRINDRPIYYWVDRSNSIIPEDAGFVGLINCRNITASNLTLSNEGRILIVNSSDITVEDIIMENDEYAVDVVLSRKIIFENLSIDNTKETPITLIQTRDSAIKNVTIKGTNTGIYIGDSTNISVTKVSLSFITGWRGIAVVNGDNINISANNLKNVENEWSIVADNSYNVLISQNHIENSKAGILSYNSTNIRVLNNRIADITSWPGIEILIGSENVTVKGNTLYSLNPDSISIHDCHDITVSNNLINRTNGQGIHVYRAEDVLLESNSVLNSGESGILVEDGSHNITIKNSNVYNNTGGIALISSSNVSIMNSTVHDNGYPRNWSGVYLWNTTDANIINSLICHNAFAGVVLNGASEALIKDTEVCNHTFASGIEVYHGSHAKILNTTVHRNAHAGIWIIHPKTSATIEGSAVYGNAWSGVEFHNGAIGTVNSSAIFDNALYGVYTLNTTQIHIVNSYIHENLYWGVYLQDSGGVLVTNNIFKNNRIGLFMKGANNNVIKNNRFYGDGIFLWDPSTNMVKNDTVNGKPIIYYENLKNEVLKGIKAGQIVLVNPENVTVTNVNISNVSIGIGIVGGSNNRILNNNLTETWDGINVRYTSKVLIRGNNLINGGWIFGRRVTNSEISDNYINGETTGIVLVENSHYNVIKNNTIVSKGTPLVFVESDHNTIYLNNIYSNSTPYVLNSTLSWNSPTLIQYIYKNRAFMNYLGNYWSSYTGEDSDGDGIGDTTYSNLDKYPLITTTKGYSIVGTRLNFVIYTRTRDGKILKVFPGGTVQETSIYDSSYSVGIVNDTLYAEGWGNNGRIIRVYNLSNESLIREIQVPTGVWGLEFTPIPDGRVAFFDNVKDRIYIISENGSLLANLSIRITPDNHLQNMGGIVIGNRLIVSEDGDRNILAIDLSTYNVTNFKNLSYIPGWLGAITYHDGVFYVASSQTIYKFTENSNATPFVVLPEGNIVGMAVYGRYMYAAVNFGGRIYRIDLQSGNYEIFTEGLNYPTDLKIWARRLKGDINGDGRITATDALLYLRYVVGLSISPYFIDSGYDDLTGDGKITIADALKALRIAAGLEPPEG